MHILVTRPLPDAWETEAQIQKLGHQAILAPLLEIELAELTPESFEGASALIVTSQNALRSLSFSGLADKVRHLQVYAVGEATAKLAEDLKLRNITAGRGTAAELVPVVAERQASRQGKVLHLTGDHKAFDMKAALAEKGIAVEEVLAYRQIKAASLPVPGGRAPQGGPPRRGHALFAADGRNLGRARKEPRARDRNQKSRSPLPFGRRRRQIARRPRNPNPGRRRAYGSRNSCTDQRAGGWA